VPSLGEGKMRKERADVKGVSLQWVQQAKGKHEEMASGGRGNDDDEAATSL